MTQYLINALGLAFVAAGQSMIASAAAPMTDFSDPVIWAGDGPGGPGTALPLMSPAAIAAAELDSQGLPWDERIHAGTKSKTAVGAWTKKKGVDETTSAAVIKQLREKYPAPAVASPQVAMPVAPQVALPGFPTAMTPYQELCAWLAVNTGEDKELTSQWVTDQFKAASTTLAELATAETALLKQWLDAFKGVLAQVQA